jgi:sigma54-dependent transcription regulator
MSGRKLVVFGLLGTTLDAGQGKARWGRWRPTIALVQQEDLRVDRLELLHGAPSAPLADTLVKDIAHVSPETEVSRHVVDFADPWDFERVYRTLHDFATGYPFDPDHEDYLVHITTGTHVAQICLFLLTESRHFPARLLQLSPRGESRRGMGTYSIIDLDLSKYDRYARPSVDDCENVLVRFLGEERARDLDRFERVQLADVLSVCASARSLSAAGRELFACSRQTRASVNDADRLRKYLARFGLDFSTLKEPTKRPRPMA